MTLCQELKCVLPCTSIKNQTHTQAPFGLNIYIYIHTTMTTNGNSRRLLLLRPPPLPPNRIIFPNLRPCIARLARNLIRALLVVGPAEGSWILGEAEG